MNRAPQSLDCLSTEYVEAMLEEYLRDPALVPEAWRGFFRDLINGQANGNGANGHAHVQGGNGHSPKFKPSFQPSSLFNPPISKATIAALPAPGKPAAMAGLDLARLQDRVSMLIRAYRVRGHLVAKIDPLGVQRPDQPELSPQFYGFTEADMARTFSAQSIGGPETQTLRDIVRRLQKTYCRNIAAQFMHIDDLTVRDWLQKRMEETENHIKLSRDVQLRILKRLTDAVTWEEFVRRKHVGAKTFSLEGAESLIPLLDLAIEKAGQQGCEGVVLGMAHRGRLNVLANVMGKQPHKIFWEFKDAAPQLFRGRGDVKYHLGYSSDWQMVDGRKVHLTLCFNPSHLEFVNAVAMGRMRAKMDRIRDENRERGLVILIHGDAAFAGEGIVQETLNMSQLPGYSVGGTLHVVVNNQVGFTTLPEESRSTTYATDVAKMLQIPIFHVNGEDPEAVAQAVNLAMDFRRTFHRDVVIDMYCYRRWGHNEGDEPGFTQPQMYKIIEQADNVRNNYVEHLLLLGGVTVDEANRIQEESKQHLEGEFAAAQKQDFIPEFQTLGGIWQGYRGGHEPDDDEAPTSVEASRVAELLVKSVELPTNFNLHPKLKKTFEKRLEMSRGESSLDWAAGEAVAFASLVTTGHRVRLSGQDSERGTFSHRHSVLHDVQDGHTYCPLNHLSPNQAKFDVVNSPLCEAGVLGFEYGYSLDSPEGLIAWEAQFGDFWNVAQVIVDQFIASAEDKWRRLSGLVLLLPHGFEGQGPEHSSARVERFLQLAAEDNLQIVSPTTPAQLFHLLRRQVIRKWRKPLVVLTPKSLLRHPKVVSPLADFTSGRFQRVLADDRTGSDLETSRIILCSGKVHYDLIEQRERRQRNDVAILRVEQLYPLPKVQLQAMLDAYRPGTKVIWVQEEPENMGAWRYLRVLIGETLFQTFPFSGIARAASASPATGSHESHKIEQQEILARAFDGE